MVGVIDPLEKQPPFHDPTLKIVWASLAALGPDQLLELELELRRRLQLGGLPSGRLGDERQAAAIDALRAAAELLGCSPSVRAYEQLRVDRPDLELPASSSIRQRLAGGWNDCLRRAQLEIVPDGDLPVAAGPPTIDDATLIERLRECASDLGVVPTANLFTKWCCRADVLARAGRRFRSYRPYYRAFGSWNGAIVAAGLAGEAVRRRNGSLDPTVPAYSVEECKAALGVVYASLGFSPTASEYDKERRRLVAEWELAGELRPLPVSGTLRRQFDTWAETLAAAGLPPRRPRRAAKPVKHALFSDDDLLEAIRAAYRDLGEPLTRRRYAAWRRSKRLARVQGWRSLPGDDTITNRFGGWHRGLEGALDS